MQDSTLCSILDGCIRDDPASKYVLGTYFASGWYTKSDLKKAETLYTALAEMSPPHWAARGVCYVRGWRWRGDEYGEMTAIECWIQGKREGNPLCTHELAYCYMDGEGLQPDLEEAERLFKIASSAGYIPATFALGLCLEKKAETDAEYKKVAELYALAAGKGWPLQTSSRHWRRNSQA
uniref:Uncharacterized protein n=1 Tax=Palpitomonas bilix TaxID=652834 RepID=A0A7S3G942_9EUKA|mmetsp:Transcript_36394/g.94658  ORF Transcript_36394/g.94658 Transcript_36394/m.94658 type:complete len:179 (+) Transcript_36394:173-709(+)